MSGGWFLPALAGLLSGMAGAMGLGGGSILLLYLTLWAGVPQLRAQGINLIFFIPNAVVALLLHSRSGLVDWRTALLSALAGLLGAGGGFLLAERVGDGGLRTVFGIFMLLLGLRELFAKPSDEAERSRRRTI